MLKILWRMLMILLVVVLVAGGIYLLAQQGALNTLVGQSGGFSHGNGFSHGAGFPTGGAIARPGYTEGGHGQGGFSLSGLAGVATQAGKVALITVAVVAIKAVARLLKRRNKPAKLAAA